MATNNRIESKYEWGDNVIISSNAPEQFKIGTLGSICGIGEVQNAQVSKQLGVPIGEILYLVEVFDGRSIEIPERYLEDDK